MSQRKRKEIEQTFGWQKTFGLMRKLKHRGLQLASWSFTEARETLAAARPVVFLSTHGPEAHRDSIDLLRALGYGLSPIPGGDLDTTAEVLALPAR